MTQSKENVIAKYMKDAESKANSLYGKGYTAGKTDGYALWKETHQETYEKGVYDGMVAALRLVKMDGKECEEMFGWCSLEYILKHNDPIEVFRKLSEISEAEAIEVGDEVEDENGLRGIVTNTDTHYHIMYPNGKTWKAPKSYPFKKTGKKGHILL